MILFCDSVREHGRLGTRTKRTNGPTPGNLIRMSNVRYPTYFLAPNWTFRPGGRIQIGNIIVDPLLPHKVLVKPDEIIPLPTETAQESNWQLATETIRSLSLNVWAAFLYTIGVKVGASRLHVKSGQFTMDSLVTESIKDDPSEAYINALCENSQVRPFMRLDHLLCKPVYIVTGLKVAKGFRFSGVDNRSSGITGDATAKVTAEVTTGGAVDASNSKALSDQFEADNDIIFAYQLMMVKPKGWTKDKKVEVKDFTKHALLDARNDQPESKIEVETEILRPAHFKREDGFQVKDMSSEGFEGVGIVSRS